MNIRSLVAISVLSIAPFTDTIASPAVTKEGYVACLTEEWLDDFVSFAVAKDEGSMKAYLSSDKCIILKGGLKVTIVDAGFTRHQFAYQGLKLWTLAEGLSRR